MLDGDQIFLVAKKGGHVTCFWKAFDDGFCKKCHKLAIIVIKKI
jgi:hypothetical protein